MGKKRLENIFAICMITVFMGQVYFTPFSQWFRFSLAVVVLSLLLIHFKDVSIMFVSTCIAILMFLFRGLVHFIAYHEMSLLETLVRYLPVTIFYLTFGLFFEIFNIRNRLKNPMTFILYLWICDSVGNMAEAFLRSFRTNIYFEKEILTIILVGFVRSLITFFINKIILYYKNTYERGQKENKFRELLLFNARLKTELFFLRKSMVDIEDMMEKSYQLYKRLQEPELKNQALYISRNIHEIKKDYLRVVLGIEETLSEGSKSMFMSVEEIFKIIEDNTQKLINISNKNISLKHVVKDNFYTNDFYPLISILNNLIINSIDAIELMGEIIIEEERIGESYIFKITDNGIGIEEDDIDLIFEPGFTTKIDTVTGKMSTGIGLSHVKYIVENHYEGNIIVKYGKGENTTFQITIPAVKIEMRK
ncbi:ATP-binding protein [Crassaminicella thermophila]|uniref:histidine kinase n=1 Tax=Crassaminicella thermophila TaxID=2599308 RepID=A0A5C0SCA5_CRATE|nr:ATP-binding protein [Crassaminicella thermophila]QEK11336.1 ATP-binding protein [Crassaminicella thermophila]